MSAQQWQQFLQDSATQNPMNSISQLSANDTAICDLSHLGLLQIQGADAVTFLQGQVTNDVKLLNGHRAHYSGYCSPKGRMLALFLAFSHHGHIHLQMPKELLEPITKRLKMYVMRSKVDIQDISESIIKIGLSGTDAEAMLGTLFSEIPQSAYDLVTQENGAVLKLAGTIPRFEIFTDIVNAQTIWSALSQQAKIAGENHWEWLEIQAGIPEVYLKTQEAFVPQMLNLDLLKGINFKKGCYTGQEIVARTHYLGSIKRRTHLAHIDAFTQPNAGDDVLNSQQELIGKVVRSAQALNGGYDMLAEVRLDSIETEPLFVNNAQLELMVLPYQL